MSDTRARVVDFKIVDGKFELDAQGFQGEGCEAAVEFLVGLGESEIKYKPEHGREGGERVRATA